jgi:deoxyribose-phosphate aldolase
MADVTLKDIAKMIDHSLLHPTMTDEQLQHECEVALKYDVASVCIKPYAVPLAVDMVGGTDVAVGTVVGFPHGNSHTSIKLAEAVRACEEGAVELDMVVNIGKVLGNQWDYVRREVREFVNAAERYDAITKLIFENDFLDEDETKIKLCEICNECGVDYAKTSSGYGMVKQPNGFYTYFGATDHDLKLMREHCAPEVKIKAAGAVRTLDDTLRVREIGADRIGASATEKIMEEAIARGYE